MTGITRRGRIERASVRRVLVETRKAGFVPVCVWDGSEHLRRTSERGVLRGVFSDSRIYNPTIHFAPIKHRDRWGTTGVAIVHGNGSYCLSNWHTGNRRFAAAIQRAAKWTHARFDAVMTAIEESERFDRR